ncbi:MAG: glycerate kinase [Nitrospira bacterium SG8_3]|nr:MAG: glycerate kinase [Nitrospira bacterium SG8_3]
MSVQQSILEEMRNQALEIFQAALRAVEPVEAILKHVKMEGESLLIGKRRMELSKFDRILVVGAGKADAPMAQAVESLLGERVSDGIIVVKDGHGLPLQRVKVHEASHPVPDERGLGGTEEILSLVSGAGERDLVICLISGGGSALLVAPAQGVTLKDKQQVTQLLLACGASIHEINTVRKHLSRVKGGGLAHAAHPATLVSLILSDVIGDDLDTIASGPTVPDSTTFHQAGQILERYGIWDQVPGSVRMYVKKGVKGEIAETPKPGDPSFQRDAWELVGTNLQALKAARKEAERLGYRTMILSGMMEGETREVAKAHAAIAKEVLNSENPIAPPACVLSGGETTVTLQGDGKGGRNTEFALASAIALEGVEHVIVLSGGTDGTDGLTDAAGAFADGKTVVRARQGELDPTDYIRRNDSYTFFETLGGLVITGPTRTNVMDVCVMLVRR